ncbi:hypothetical protein AXX16_0515 [Serratia rubidaea]|nr:hypothetical protein AXX16_0515 [Serratia rubidaea]
MVYVAFNQLDKCPAAVIFDGGIGTLLQQIESMFKGHIMQGSY